MKLLSCEKAEAELVGHVIILGITILGVSMIALYGVPAIYSLEDMANVRNVEQSFAVLDSRASRAILGDSPLQITSINLGGGSLTVEPNSSGSPSYIFINSTIFNVTIPMGKVKYQLGDRIVAYEGGGVWSKYPSGSVMLSRPEFNYNGVTLTFPVFDINGTTSVGGKGTAAVSFKKPASQVLFPNTNTSNSGGVNRTNPVNFTIVEKVYVNITSDFYDAWADHVETAVKSAKVVSVDTKNRTTSIALTVYPAYIGKSDSDIKNPIDFRGLDPSNSTPLSNFSFRIYKSPSFKDLKWDIRTASGTKRLVFEFSPNSQGTYANVKIGYKQGSGPGTVETWTNTTDLVLVTGSDPDAYADMDLLNKSINLTYDSTGVGTTSSQGCGTDQIDGSGNQFNDTGFSWAGTLIEGTTEKSLYNITQHYIQLMAQDGDFSFGQCSPGGTKGPSSNSGMFIDYYAPGGLTYLHITDNKADVGIS